MTKGLGWFVALGLLVSIPVSSGAGTNPSLEPTRDRSSTVVVRVADDGFHWGDAGVGVAATLAMTLLVLGLSLILRPEVPNHAWETHRMPLTRTDVPPRVEQAEPDDKRPAIAGNTTARTSEEEQ